MNLLSAKTQALTLKNPWEYCWQKKTGAGTLSTKRVGFYDWPEQVSPANQFHFCVNLKVNTLYLKWAYHATRGVHLSIRYTLEIFFAATIVFGAVTNRSKGRQQVLYWLKVRRHQSLFPGIEEEKKRFN